MIRSTLRAATVALVAVLALSGCSQDSRPVARVGSRTLTVGDFKRAAARAAAQGFALPPEQARPLVLREMVGNELLVVAAQGRGRDTTAAARLYRQAVTEKALLGALAAQLSPIDVGVSEGELRTLYEWRKTQSDAEVVFAIDSTSVLQALREIRSGVPLARVADEFAGGFLPPGGQLGYVLPGTVPQPVDEAVRTLPVGQLGGPYRAAQGWFLVRVKRRSPAPVAPYEQQRAMLENMLRQRKWQSTLLAAVARLGPEYHLSVAADAGQELFRYLTPGRVTSVTVAPPGPAERARVLARFDGGVLTLGDAWDDLARPDVNKPNSGIVSSLQGWVRDRAMTRLALVEARRRHLQEDPSVAGPLADDVNGFLVRLEAQDAVAPVAPPDEAGLRATWDELKSNYPMLREARVQWAVVADTAQAMAIGQRSGEGQGWLRDIAHAVNPAIVVHEETVTFPSGDPEWDNQQGPIQRLSPGQWLGPEMAPDGFRLTQLVSKSMGILSWDQLPAQARQSLAQQAISRAQEARLNAYKDSLQRAIQPVLLEDVVRRIPWPAAAPSAAAMR